jgi:CrcB protein
VLTGLAVFHSVPADLKLIAGTGFCGGYTTFSTASFESVRLIQRGAHLAAIVNTAGTAAVTLGAAALGMVVAR